MSRQDSQSVWGAPFRDVMTQNVCDDYDVSAWSSCGIGRRPRAAQAGDNGTCGANTVLQGSRKPTTGVGAKLAAANSSL